MNQGILGNARVRGGSPERPIATRAEALAGADRGLVITPETLHLSRRGTGRAWFWELFHDFAMQTGGGAGDGGTDGCGWFNQSSGSGSSFSTVVFPFRGQDFGVRQLSGVVSINTGTTSTGRGGFDSTSGVTTHRFDTGVTFMESLIYIQDLATAAEDYVFRWGHVRGTGLTNDQMCFEYNRANNPNWVGLCSLNGVSTRFDIGVPVESGKWIRLRATWSAAAASFQVNDQTAAGGSTANIRPDGGGYLGAHIIKTAGTTTRGVALDYVYYRHDFTNERSYT